MCFEFLPFYYRLNMAFEIQVNFQVANALNQPFKNDTFDLVWSMESGEHMPDKKQVSSLYRKTLCRVVPDKLANYLIERFLHIYFRGAV